ncbi:hypothetical protein KCP69_06465 [Salmonella enterica subsp. enterica]|nr:hypothetical protein KCP69_06465 [Salmonella enterica subsp. enterica]
MPDAQQPRRRWARRAAGGVKYDGRRPSPYRTVVVTIVLASVDIRDGAQRARCSTMRRRREKPHEGRIIRAPETRIVAQCNVVHPAALVSLAHA